MLDLLLIQMITKLLLANPCEAAPFRVEYNILNHDKLKGHHLAMPTDDTLADKFVGGTVFQSYLNNNFGPKSQNLHDPYI